MSINGVVGCGAGCNKNDGASCNSVNNTKKIFFFDFIVKPSSVRAPGGICVDNNVVGETGAGHQGG